MPPIDSLTHVLHRTYQDVQTVGDDSAAGQARSSLESLNTMTPTVMSRYQRARHEFILAAAALERHGEHFDIWMQKLSDAGGSTNVDPPPVVDLVTMEEIEQVPQ